MGKTLLQIQTCIILHMYFLNTVYFRNLGIYNKCAILLPKAKPSIKDSTNSSY
jgi:hypothetical protein